MIKELIEKLSNSKAMPCVTISLNTHRTHPDNLVDAILLKNLCKDAENRLLQEYEKGKVLGILEKLESVQTKLNMNYNLDSLHIFISNDELEVFKSPWPADYDAAIIDDRFSLRFLIKELSRTVEYNILLLSQSGVHLYEAVNDSITNEIVNEDFPFERNPFFHTNPAKNSDSKSVDNQVREYINRVDKAALKVFHINHLPFIVVCTEDNYSKLMQVSDRPQIYLGYTPINYNETQKHHIAPAAWEILKELNAKNVKAAISEMQEAAGHGKILTDVAEIYRAAKEGRGDFLITHSSFSQAAIIGNNNEIELIEEEKTPGAIDDITSEIAKEIITKKGNVIFTSKDELKALGDMVLKVRY